MTPGPSMTFDAHAPPIWIGRSVSRIIERRNAGAPRVPERMLVLRRRACFDRSDRSEQLQILDLESDLENRDEIGAESAAADRDASIPKPAHLGCDLRE